MDGSTRRTSRLLRRLRIQERLPHAHRCGRAARATQFNRAIDVYLTQMPAVRVIEASGPGDFGAKGSNQVIIWESLMDAETLAAHGEHRDGLCPGIHRSEEQWADRVEAPPKMLGFAMDTLQRYLVDIGPLGPDKGQGGKYPVPTARLFGRGAGRLLRRQIANLQRQLRPARLQGGR